MSAPLIIMGAHQALQFSEFLVALSSIILSAEVLLSRELFDECGLLSWRVDRLRHCFAQHEIWRVTLLHLLGDRPFMLLQALRLAVAVILAFFICTDRSTWTLLTLLAAITLISHFRTSASNDGSDQFTLIILVACALAEFIGSPLLLSGACLFIAGEATIAYLTSGWLKLLEPGWRDGSMVTGILASSTFGDRGLYLIFAKHSRVSIIGGWIVVSGDCMLGIAALFPPSICAVLLLFGVALHLGIARVLGLNTFLWAFCATYAPTLFVSTEFYRMLSSN